MHHLSESTSGCFPTTQWTAVRVASLAESTGHEALSGLLARYRRPLLMHLRRQFQATEEQTEDWLHDFIEKRILEKQILAGAKKKRGRFRGFLLCALDNFVINALHHESRGIRRPSGGFVSMDSWGESTPMANAAMETNSFDVEWARAVLDQAVRRLEEYYRHNERKDLWGVFQEAFLNPTLEGNDPPPMAQLAERYGFADASQASNGLVTAKRMFRRMLEMVVSEYLDEGQSFEDEIRDLIHILGGVQE